MVILKLLAYSLAVIDVFLKISAIKNLIKNVLTHNIFWLYLYLINT